MGTDTVKRDRGLGGLKDYADKKRGGDKPERTSFIAIKLLRTSTTNAKNEVSHPLFLATDNLSTEPFPSNYPNS